MVIPLGRKLPPASCDLPEGIERATRPLLGLAPGGVCRAPGVTTWAVSPYLTFSPLPAPYEIGPLAVYFLWHFPKVTLTGRYPAPCPMEPGLSSHQMVSDHSPTLTPYLCPNLLIYLLIYFSLFLYKRYHIWVPSSIAALPLNRVGLNLGPLH